MATRGRQGSKLVCSSIQSIPWQGSSAAQVQCGVKWGKKARSLVQKRADRRVQNDQNACHCLSIDVSFAKTDSHCDNITGGIPVSQQPLRILRSHAWVFWRLLVMNSWSVASPEATDHSKVLRTKQSNERVERKGRSVHCPNLEGDGHELEMVHCSPGHAKSQHAESLRSWEFEASLYLDFKKVNAAWICSKNRKHAEAPASEWSMKWTSRIHLRAMTPRIFVANPSQVSPAFANCCPQKQYQYICTQVC